MPAPGDAHGPAGGVDELGGQRPAAGPPPGPAGGPAPATGSPLSPWAGRPRARPGRSPGPSHRAGPGDEPGRCAGPRPPWSRPLTTASGPGSSWTPVAARAARASPSALSPQKPPGGRGPGAGLRRCRGARGLGVVAGRGVDRAGDEQAGRDRAGKNRRKPGSSPSTPRGHPLAHGPVGPEPGEHLGGRAGRRSPRGCGSPAGRAGRPARAGRAWTPARERERRVSPRWGRPRARRGPPGRPARRRTGRRRPPRLPPARGSPWSRRRRPCGRGRRPLRSSETGPGWGRRTPRGGPGRRAWRTPPACGHRPKARASRPRSCSSRRPGHQTTSSRSNLLHLFSHALCGRDLSLLLDLTRGGREPQPHPHRPAGGSPPRGRDLAACRPRRWPWPASTPSHAPASTVQLDVGPFGPSPCRQDHQHGPPLPGPGRQPPGHARPHRPGRADEHDVHAVEQGGGGLGPQGARVRGRAQVAEVHPELGEGHHPGVGHAHGRTPRRPPRRRRGARRPAWCTPMRPPDRVPSDRGPPPHRRSRRPPLQPPRGRGGREEGSRGRSWSRLEEIGRARATSAASDVARPHRASSLIGGGAGCRRRSAAERP